MSSLKLIFSQLLNLACAVERCAIFQLCQSCKGFLQGLISVHASWMNMYFSVKEPEYITAHFPRGQQVDFACLQSWHSHKQNTRGLMYSMSGVRLESPHCLLTNLLTRQGYLFKSIHAVQRLIWAWALNCITSHHNISQCQGCMCFIW